jgi:DNA-binding FadR family transcriptional regulator
MSTAASFDREADAPPDFMPDAPSGPAHGLAPSAVAMLGAPLPGANRMEATVERLGTAVQLRLLEPGQQLPPERELAGLIGVSRVTLRSALGALQDAGLIKVRRGRSGGTFVADVPPNWNLAAAESQALEDGGFCAWRMMVEPAVCELASKRITPASLQELHTRLDRMRRLLDDLPLYRAEDARFHIAIAEATGNARMVRAVTEIQADLGRVISLLPPNRAVLQHSNRQHARLLAALADGNARHAGAVMLEHLTATDRFASGLLPTRRAL